MYALIIIVVLIHVLGVAIAFLYTHFHTPKGIVRKEDIYFRQWKSVDKKGKMHGHYYFSEAWDFSHEKKEGVIIDYNISNPRYLVNNQIILIDNLSSLFKLLSKLVNPLIIYGLFIVASMPLLTIGFLILNGNFNGLNQGESFVLGNLMIGIPFIFIIPIIGIVSMRGTIYNELFSQKMESLGFEKSFDAFSRDPVEARMIITPAFMDRLEQFSDTWQLKGKIRIIWEKDTFTLLLKGDIEKYGKESDGSYTLVKSMEEMLNLEYYSLPPTNTNNG